MYVKKRIILQKNTISKRKEERMKVEKYHRTKGVLIL